MPGELCCCFLSHLKSYQCRTAFLNQASFVVLSIDIEKYNISCSWIVLNDCANCYNANQQAKNDFRCIDMKMKPRGPFSPRNTKSKVLHDKVRALINK